MKLSQKMLIVLGVAVIAIVFLYVSGKAKTPVPITPKDLSNTESATSSKITTSLKTIVTSYAALNPMITDTHKEKDALKSYNYTATYPKSDSAHLSEIHDFVAQNKATFLNDYETVSDKEAKLFAAQWPYTYTLTTRIATSTNSISYIIETYVFEGGAHGSTNVKTFTYNTHSKLLTLDDVFSKPYLETVASLARQYFYTHAVLANNGTSNQKNMIDDGTRPTTDNFSEWYLTPHTITFIFGQYQVGPYVLGIQEFPLLKSKVSALMSDSYK